MNAGRDIRARVDGDADSSTTSTVDLCSFDDRQQIDECCRSLVERLPDTVFVSCEGRFVFINTAGLKLFGAASPDQLLGKPVMEFIHLDFRVIAQRLIATMNREPGPSPMIEERFLRLDGSVVEVEVAARPFTFEGKAAAQIVVHDITERKRTEESLRASESRYRSLFENMIEGFAYCQMVFQDGRPLDFIYLAVNRAVGALTGLNDLVGKRVTEVIPGIRETNPELFEIYGRVAQSGRSERFETYVQPLSMWLSISAFCPQPGYFVATFDNITERKTSEQRLQTLSGQLRALAANVHRAREEERANLAREIHDVVAQELTRLKLDLARMQRRLARPMKEPARQHLLESLTAAVALTDTSLGSIQRIATGLRPVVLDSLGLCAAIQWQAAEFMKITGIRCDASVPTKDPPLNRECSTALFRIVQEALTNVARHAHASRVVISLRCEGEQLLLAIHDDGCGMTPKQLTDPLSLGLLGMRERALLLGAQIEFTSHPGQGTAVQVSLPREVGRSSREQT